MKNLTLFFLCFLMAIGQLSAQLVSPTAGPAKGTNQLLLNKRIKSSGAVKANIDPILKPFYHGVASGDPLSDAVVIWTRVTPDSTAPINVQWRISTDTLMSDTIAIGTFTTDSSRDYTVKVDVQGLNSNTTYYYMFTANNKNSLIGRTKTAPAAAQANHLKFGVVSCSNFEAGFFNSYGRLGDYNDLDAIIHLGDYIYEYEAGNYGDSALQASGIRSHDTVETISLDQYRARYSLYRLDEDLRRAHQQHPFINIWDDHESANDAYVDGAENHDPSEGPWATRKAISKQAFFEWIPIRDNSADTIYRTLNYGNLVDLIMLDTRLEGRDSQINDVTNPNLYSPTRTLLGNQQRNWFLNALNNSSAKWKIVGNQVIFSEFHVGWAAQAPATPAQTESIFLDIWDGYPAERLTIINYLETNNIDNVVFLTGDFHSTFAFDVADSVTNPGAFYAPTPNYDPATGNGSVAVEFATPSVSSANFDENLDPVSAAGIEFQINNPLPTTTNNIPNPHLKYVDLDQHGYYILDVKDDSTQANYYFVDIFDTLTTNQSFGQAWYTRSDSNHLERASAASAPKAQQADPAPLTPPSVGVSITELKSTFDVLALYPNPADQMVSLQFGMSAPKELRIEILDLKGSLVNEVKRGSLNKGIYNFNFSVADLPNGIYFLRMNTEDQSLIRKLVIQH